MKSLLIRCFLLTMSLFSALPAHTCSASSATSGLSLPPSAPHQSRKVRSQGGGVSVSPSLSEGRSYSVYQRRDTQQFCRLRDDKTISGNTPQIRGFQKNSFLINYAEVSLCCFPPCRRMFSTLPKATT